MGREQAPAAHFTFEAALAGAVSAWQQFAQEYAVEFWCISVIARQLRTNRAKIAH